MKKTITISTIAVLLSNSQNKVKIMKTGTHKRVENKRGYTHV